LPSLSIEELNVNKEKEEGEHNKGLATEMFAIMKQAELTVLLLLGKPEVGTWALKHKWLDGNGVKELKLLIPSNDSRAMSTASEIVSVASSIESARPLLATLDKVGTLEDLLIHPDADVRSGAASCMAKIGLATGKFNLIAVSINTLCKEAFIKKEIILEQYDQLQELGKMEEEKKKAAKIDKKEGDDPALVGERIQKLASANVPRAMVKLLEGLSSDATQEKVLEGMGRMMSELSVCGIIIQQGCLMTCLQLDKGDKPNDTGEENGGSLIVAVPKGRTTIGQTMRRTWWLMLPTHCPTRAGEEATRTTTMMGEGGARWTMSSK
jgi:hypothetical protein